MEELYDLTLKFSINLQESRECETGIRQTDRPRKENENSTENLYTHGPLVLNGTKSMHSEKRG